MPCKKFGVLRLALWLLCGLLGRVASFNHWLVTEEGKIEFQIGSPFNLRQPFNLHALLQQEERVSSLHILRDQLLNFRDEFEGIGSFESFEESFYARDPDCRHVPSITSFDLYVSTVLPLDHKKISLSDHLDPVHSRLPGEPYCISPLDFSVYALEHLKGVQERSSLTAPAERSVLASVNMKMETFGNIVHQALQQNSTSWVLLDLASLYWRARGNQYNAVECIRRALHYSPVHALDIAYLNLANVLHRSHYSADARVPLRLAIEISPNVNILHYTLGNSLGKLNESISEYRYSLSLEPTSEPVLSVYSSVLCAIRKFEASMEYGRKLDATQAKLDEFYDKVELVKKSHIVEKGHRGQWDIDTSQRHSERVSSDDDDESEDQEEEDEEEEEVSVTIVEEMEEEEGEGEREMEGEGELSEGEEQVEDKGELEEGHPETHESGREGGRVVETDNDGDKMSDQAQATDDSAVVGSGGGTIDSSGNGMANSVMPHSRGGSKLRLVLRPLPDDECCKCGPKVAGSGPPQVAPISSTAVHSCTGWDCWQIDQPVCRLPSPFLNYSRYPSGYCAETRGDCAEIEKMGKPGTSYCEVKGQTTRATFSSGNSDTFPKVSASLNCAVAENGQSDCLLALQQQLRQAEQRRIEQREKVMKREMEKREGRVSGTKLKVEKKVPVSELKVEKEKPVSENHTPNIPVDKPPTDKNLGKLKSKKSEYSAVYQALEFLPYNPLPTHMEELIFPEHSRPLAIFDDPYWPNKASCIKLVESLKGTSALSTFTGTYLSPEAKGVGINPFFKKVPYPVPPYLRQQPRCTDIVELPFSLQAMDHLYPVKYRAHLVGSKRQGENGLKKVLMNAISTAMGRTLSFEESGEAVYAAMVKNGPNWALFTVASIYWRVSGEPKHSIECLRRTLHYSPSGAKDVGYIGLANVFHRYGFMNEAVVAARAGLDVVEESPVSHYTLAGIYLTLGDYTAASLHLRASLHLQPTFEHALSALRLVRCSLKFKEEKEQLRIKLNQPEGRELRPHETTLATDLTRALDSLANQEKIRQPPPVTKPEELVTQEEGADGENPFIGEDAVRYMTGLALLRKKRKMEVDLESEKERKERQREIERRLREEMSRVENDGSLEEFIKNKRSQEGETEFARQMRYESSQLDITPLMKQVASRIQAENNNYDPQLIAQSRAEIEAELRDIVVASARAIANNQSPVQHTTPVRVIENQRSPSSVEEREERREEDVAGDTKTPSEQEKGSGSERGDSTKKSEPQKAKTADGVRRYPGYQPWPSLQDCAAMSLPKTLIFTSTWLSVTAKKVKVDEHIDFTAPLNDVSLKPYCPVDFPESPQTFPNLAGMSGVLQVDQYKPERGLMEVLCNLSGAYRSVEDVATRINISMAMNGSSWVLSNLAALYWRVVGDGGMAINCLKHSLYHSDLTNKEVALVSLANVLYRLGYESDATAIMQHSLEVNPKLVVNHFTMANLLAARGFPAEAAGYFESTLQFQPGFEPAKDRLKAVRCISLLKHIQETREKEEKRKKEYEAELERQLYEHRKALGHFN